MAEEREDGTHLVRTNHANGENGQLTTGGGGGGGGLEPLEMVVVVDLVSL